MSRRTKAPAQGAYQPGQVLPIIDQIWAANHKLAQDREPSPTVDGMSPVEAARELLELSKAICTLRDSYDEAGWDQASRWLNQAALAFNMAARMPCMREVYRG